jgi:hypothetical protein
MVETKLQSIKWLEIFGRFQTIFKKFGQQFFVHPVWRLGLVTKGNKILATKL